MKKLIILLLVLMMAVFSVNAAAGTSDTGDTITTTKKVWVEKENGGAKLTIKAYKKDKSASATYTMKVIDALTGSLDDIKEYEKKGKSKEIKIDDYVGKYIGTIDDEVGIKKRAIFSIHIGGNVVASNFSVSVTFGPLALYTTTDNGKTWSKTTDKNNVIKVQYWMRDMNYFFTSTGAATSTSSGSEEKISSSPKNSSVTVSDLNPVADSNVLEFSWSVSSSNSVSDYWDVETMFAMIIDSSTYESKVNGTYMAPITITLTYGS